MNSINFETRSHQKLRSRIEYLRSHLEISDVALHLTMSLLNKETDPNCKIITAMEIDGKRYKHLNHPVNQRNRIINHSRAKLSEFAVISTYTHFAEYLQGLLAEMYECNPLMVVGKGIGNHSLPFAEIVKHGDFTSISEHMVSQVFRSMENERSTRKLLDRILSNTDVEIDEGVKDNALCYLEMRHIFIHRSGLADENFVNAYGSRFSLAIGDKLPTDFQNADMAISAASILCNQIDTGLIKKGLAKTVNPKSATEV